MPRLVGHGRTAVSRVRMRPFTRMVWARRGLCEGGWLGKNDWSLAGREVANLSMWAAG